MDLGLHGNVGGARGEAALASGGARRWWAVAVREGRRPAGGKAAEAA
jgi:hypothetical protein